MGIDKLIKFFGENLFNKREFMRRVLESEKVFGEMFKSRMNFEKNNCLIDLHTFLRSKYYAQRNLVRR